MTVPHHILAIMLRKFERRAPLGEDDRRALLDLSHRVQGVEAGSYLVREGERPEVDRGEIGEEDPDRVEDAVHDVRLCRSRANDAPERPSDAPARLVIATRRVRRRPAA